MTARTIDFDYSRCTGTYSGVSDGLSTAYGAYFNAYARPSMPRSHGRQLILNGVAENAMVPYAEAGTGTINSYTTTPSKLIIPAPNGTLTPLLSWPGSGNIYGKGYLWRYRWKNVRTGDVSGFSPTSSVRWNVGVESSPGSAGTLGQNAFFHIPRITSSTAPGTDYALQLFRNTAAEEGEFFLVKEVLIGSSSYIDITDDLTDDQIVTNEVASVQPNPSFNEGAIFPVCKGFLHSTGRMFLFGVQQMGPFRSGSVNATAGSNYVTNAGSTPIFFRARIGQRFRFLATSGGTTISDPTIYRIVDVDVSNQYLYINPPVVATSQMSSLAYAAATYEITDDRDERTLFMSEPGLPCNYDLLNTIYVGFDQDDALLHVFAMGERTYAQTRRHLYRLDDDATAEPSLSIRLTQVADEGTVGFHSGVLTPLGWVYAHATRGIRIFDGSTPRALGADGPLAQFPLLQQFNGTGDTEFNTYSSYSGLSNYGVEPSLLGETTAVYDPNEHLIHIFYAPVGKWALEEEIVYDPDTDCWRGPWRRRCTASGNLRNSDGTEVFAFGEDLGNLWLDNQQPMDLINGTGGSGAEQTSTAGGKYAVLYKSAGAFDSTAQKEQGVPVVMYSPSGTPTQTLVIRPVIDVIDTENMILDTMQIDVSSTYSFRVGAIRWFLRTAYFDGGEPIQPKRLERLRLRVQRAAASASTATTAVILDEDTTVYAGEGTGSGTPAAVTSVSVSFVDVRLRQTAKTFSIAMYGTNVTGDPKATVVAAEMVIESGA